MRLQLSPRQAYNWFRVIETRIALAGGPSAVSIAGENPDRVVIEIIRSGTADVRVGTERGLAADAGNPLTASVPWVRYQHFADGALTQVQWFAITPIAAVITVRETILDYEAHASLEP